MINKTRKIEEIIRRIKISNPTIIGIDGGTDSGKSFLARRVRDELQNYVVLEFDNFRTFNQTHGNKFSYELQPEDIDIISEIIGIIVKRKRGVILDGVLLLAMVEKIRYKLDYLIFVIAENNEKKAGEEIENYLNKYKPSEKASVVFINRIPC